MKAVLIIADGLGGRPTDLEGRTCLEAASTPNLDALAAQGVLGLVDPIGPGVRPGSDTAHLSLLGYNPRQVYTGRGVFECFGIGMDVLPGDICFRANLATAEETPDGLKIIDRRAGRIDAGQGELADALNAIKLAVSPKISFEFRPSTQHRGALLLRGHGIRLSCQITENDPHVVDGMVPDSKPNPDAHEDAAARVTAATVNEITKRSFELWKDHPVNLNRMQAGKPPANIVLLRGASDAPHLASIESTYNVKGAVIAGGALYRGVSLACGMSQLDVEGATGGLDTSLTAKAEATLQALRTFDYVFVHVKGTDNAGHDQDAVGKRDFIERIDRELIGPLSRRLDWSTTHIAVTGDHTTPIDFGDHTTEPVPVLFVGPNVMPDATTAFHERAAAAGGLSRFSGQVLPILLGYNNWSPKYGA
ncbi:2,3-bisphosphoglycerate-independent phosphoglycerate mutase [Candidatus Bipolaricaulota bacterium]|nr:2,3-bisphosphoglycerate-independent phosphoglycerate mutase [Candidatus Bipolaricaulota bacterium]